MSSWNIQGLHRMGWHTSVVWKRIPDERVQRRMTRQVRVEIKSALVTAVVSRKAFPSTQHDESGSNSKRAHWIPVLSDRNWSLRIGPSVYLSCFGVSVPFPGFDGKRVMDRITMW